MQKRIAAHTAILFKYQFFILIFSAYLCLSVLFSRDHAHAGAAAWRNGASAVHPFSHGGQYISEGMVVSGPGFHGPVDSGLGTRGEKTEDPAVSGPFVFEASSGWKAPAVGLYLPVC